MIYHRADQTIAPITFPPHHDLRIQLQPNTITKPCRRKPKKGESSLLSTLSVRTRKCRSDTLQRYTTFLLPLYTTEWRDAFQRLRNTTFDTSWPRPKRIQLSSISLIWIREDFLPRLKVWKIWQISCSRRVVRSQSVWTGPPASYDTA